MPVRVDHIGSHRAVQTCPLRNKASTSPGLIPRLPTGCRSCREGAKRFTALSNVACEGALVEDDERARPQVADVRFQRRRVHRDEHIPRSPDVKISTAPKVME
jgi:hypothetical protein